jgi:hypothetical protein
MSKLRSLLTAIVILGLFALPADAGKGPKAVTIFEDAAGDAGNQDSGAPGFTEAGFDLTKGELSKVKNDLKFVVTHEAMPSSGTPGEGFRFIMEFTVNSHPYAFTVKSFDIGKPDVLAGGTGTERIGQVYMGVARLEECGTEAVAGGLTLSQCNAVGYYEAAFDSASKTMTWQIPLKDIKAKKGAVIAGGGGGRSTTSCMICWVPQNAERSLTPQTVIDSAVMAVRYKVP